MGTRNEILIEYFFYGSKTRCCSDQINPVYKRNGIGKQEGKSGKKKLEDMNEASLRTSACGSYVGDVGERR